MARRFALILVECFVALILIISAVLLAASYYIDTTEFRDLFTDTLKTALKRDVDLVGDLDIAIWPTLALEVSGLDVHEASGFGEGIAAHFDDISVMVRVIPLFSRQIEVESIVVDGFKGVVVQNAEGHFNWESAIVRESQSGMATSPLPGWEFSVQSVEILGAEILLRDEKEKTEYTLSGIELRTGSIRFGEDVPYSVSSQFAWTDKEIVSDLVLKGLVRLVPEGMGLSFKDTNLQASLYGGILPKNVAPGVIVAKVDLDLDKRTVSLNDFEARFFGIRAEGNLKSGDLRKGLDISGHVTVHPFSPVDLLTRYASHLPLKDVDGLKSSALATFVRVTEEGVLFENLLFTLDDVTVRGQLGFKGYRTPVFDFSLRGNTIDFDRYLPLFKTGTPFIWDDFHLPFFRAFRGKGMIRADGFQVLDTLVSDIRLNVDANDDGITLDAGAIREGMGSLGGNMKINIGSSGDGNVPTLALTTGIDAESQKQGFAFLKQAPLDIGGAGKLRLEATVSKMQCPPEDRSIFVLRHLFGIISLALDQGAARFAKASGESLELPYSKADLEVQVSPVAGNSDVFWESNLVANLKTRGGKDIESLDVTVSGPFSMAIDGEHVKSSGLAVSGYLSPSLLPKEAKRLTVGGTVGFDSKVATMEIRDAVIQALETTLGGNVKLSGFNKNISAQGNIAISQADPKRIVYLLAGKSIATKDSDALKNVSVKSQFVADEQGFTLSEFTGELDGMPLKGHVVGTGYVQPMLAFSLAAGSFDLDRYLPPKKEPSLSELREGTVPKSEPVDLPLKFLRYLKLNGKIALNSFTLAKIRSESLSGTVKANEGIITISNIKGKLHGGTLNADLKGKADVSELATHLVLNVDNMQAGPLMGEMAEREYVQGETDLKLDLRSKGGTDDAILENLLGLVSLRVVNGSFKFTGYDAPQQKVSNARSKQIGRQAISRTDRRTAFQKVVANFTVQKGIFNMNKFRLEAPPVLQAYGEGRFSLPANSINVSIRNDFVAVPSVTLRLTGKLTDPKVDIPTGRILNDTVFNILSLPQKSFEFLRDLF